MFPTIFIMPPAPLMRPFACATPSNHAIDFEMEDRVFFSLGIFLGNGLLPAMISKKLDTVQAVPGKEGAWESKMQELFSNQMYQQTKEGRLHMPYIQCIYLIIYWSFKGCMILLYCLPGSIHSDEFTLTTLLIWVDFKNFVKNLMCNITNSKFYFFICKKNWIFLHFIGW